MEWGSTENSPPGEEKPAKALSIYSKPCPPYLLLCAPHFFFCYAFPGGSHMGGTRKNLRANAGHGTAQRYWLQSEVMNHP